MGFKQNKCLVSLKVNAELHKAIKVRSAELGISINSFVEEWLLKSLK